ncbi:alpha-D-ribose 1-methylphosphonate 5-triphosphate diphosphatase [Salibacterium aidingense]|uniref:alpha-D-ribose 1-methylphosphonate 5-triphosphate diphosphatase n=1 Tax=Salibacterium aidingense TaxID=384933 RepID=UPI003BE67A0E
MHQTIITNGTIVTPGETFKGNIVLSNGIIEDIEKTDGSSPLHLQSDNYETVNAEDKYVLPGLIDTHSDAFEKIINPRKNALFPFSFSFQAMQPQLLSCGITTMLHAVSFNGEEGLRSNENGLEIAREIEKLQLSRDASLRHFLHVRYEITNEEGLTVLNDLIEQKLVYLLSIMDHSSQYDSPYQLDKTVGLTEEEVFQLAEDARSKKALIDPSKWKKLINTAQNQGISVASHDDETKEHVEQFRQLGVTISEFPLTTEAAQYAVDHDMFTVFGAPNIIRGKSHKNSISAKEAVEKELAAIICSDYYPYSLLPSIFHLHNEGMELHQAVALATLHPAQALQVDSWLGSLETGKTADLCLVEHTPEDRVSVTDVMVNGEWNFVQRKGNVRNPANSVHS